MTTDELEKQHQAFGESVIRILKMQQESIAAQKEYIDSILDIIKNQQDSINSLTRSLTMITGVKA